MIHEMLSRDKHHRPPLLSWTNLVEKLRQEGIDATELDLIQRPRTIPIHLVGTSPTTRACLNILGAAFGEPSAVMASTITAGSALCSAAPWFFSTRRRGRRRRLRRATSTGVGVRISRAAFTNHRPRDQASPSTTSLPLYISRRRKRKQPVRCRYGDIAAAGARRRGLLLPLDASLGLAQVGCIVDSDEMLVLAMSAGARGSDHCAAESAQFQPCRIEPRALLHGEKGSATTPEFFVVSGEGVVAV